MHRQKVGIKRFPVSSEVVLITKGSCCFFFNTNTETSLFDCCRYKRGLPLAAKRLNTEAPEKKTGTKQRALRQPWQPFGVVNGECVTHSMQLWCQVACSKRCLSILRHSSISASLRRLCSLLILDFLLDFCYIMVVFPVRHFHDGKCLNKIALLAISTEH